MLQNAWRSLALHVLLCAVIVGCSDADGTQKSADTSNKNSTTSSESAPEPVDITGPTMGTRYSVKLFGVPDGLSPRVLQRGIEETLREINDRMSSWQDDSELSQFNRSTSTAWFDVSPDTALVVDEALRISRLTDGTFDVTVNPLLRLWGFGPHAPREQIPASSTIADVRSRIGYDKIHVRQDPPALRKDRRDMEIVLSGIAKGFAVDRVSEWLSAKGVRSSLVEIGGEIRTCGTKPGGRPWTVGIEKPTAHARALLKTIALTDLAMATSGDYRNYFERDGRRYSHTIDPRTGRPIEHQLASVTVIDKTCMTADALATAIMVLGPVDGYNFAVEQELAAYFIVRDGGRFIDKPTPRFTELLSR
jgi:thiamine biosynthesis lipoprotein